MKPIIFIDTETGGLDPKLHDITQIAAILDVDGQVIEELNLLLRPSAPERATAGALAVQKKTLEQVLAHPLSQKEGYEAFRANMDQWTKQGTSKALFGAQNAPFDVGFLKALFTAQGNDGGMALYFDGTVDTRYIADGLRAKGSLRTPNSKLGTICEALQVPLGAGAHDALNDIRATRLAYYKLMERSKAIAA